MKLSECKIEPIVTLTSNGWKAGLYFPNGGRQVFSSLYWTDEAAMIAAKSALKMRLEYATQLAPKDPPENQMVEI